jgi:hypothetical protein
MEYALQIVLFVTPLFLVALLRIQLCSLAVAAHKDFMNTKVTMDYLSFVCDEA